MSPKPKKSRPQKLRISATVVMDAEALARARAKAQQHNMPFEVFLENAVRFYGKYLDKRITTVARPI